MLLFITTRSIFKYNVLLLSVNAAGQCVMASLPLMIIFCSLQWSFVFSSFVRMLGRLSNFEHKIVLIRSNFCIMAPSRSTTEGPKQQNVWADFYQVGRPCVISLLHQHFCISICQIEREKGKRRRRFTKQPTDICFTLLYIHSLFSFLGEWLSAYKFRSFQSNLISFRTS